MRKIIWQYWETRGEKPAFIDGLHEIAKRNSGAEVILVTPETLADHLPSVPADLHRIGELAHKADMIRTMLLHAHGGMWLDSDAIVLKDLGWLFAELETSDFVGFTQSGRFDETSKDLRVNCFLARKGSPILAEWIAGQHAKFPRTEYEWSEVGSELLNPAALARKETVRSFPFELICPIKSKQVKAFTSPFVDSRPILDKAIIVMLNNKALARKGSSLLHRSVEDICAGRDLVADILRRALDPGYIAPSPLVRIWRSLVGPRAKG